MNVQTTNFKTLSALITCLLISNHSLAQFKIKKHSINNGGGVSSDSSYQVNGSIGQKEANNSSSGDGFNVTGGFWAAGTNNDLIYKNGFEP